VRGRLAGQRQRLEPVTRALNAVGPLATLDRGYAIVADATGKVVLDAASLRPGDRISARLARGRVAAEVLSVVPDKPDT